MLRRFLAVMVVSSAGVAAALTPPDAVKPAAPPVAEREKDLPDGTAAALKQMAAFRLPPGMRVDLFAAEPMLASPVAICARYWRTATAGR